MTDDRYRALMSDDELRLTDEELREGWHFCDQFDGLLVGPGMPEMETCHCRYLRCKGLPAESAKSFE
jgi:hypothetical protein